ncbi:MAG: hypothetical protein KF764_31520 [Labilithrix sp.]|nr:hypothetical protein [Labilithrix sp.]
MAAVDAYVQDAGDEEKERLAKVATSHREWEARGPKPDAGLLAFRCALRNLCYSKGWDPSGRTWDAYERMLTALDAIIPAERLTKYDHGENERRLAKLDAVATARADVAKSGPGAPKAGEAKGGVDWRKLEQQFLTGELHLPGSRRFLEGLRKK